MSKSKPPLHIQAVRGRGTIKGNDERVRLVTTVTPETANRIAAAANQDGRSIADWIRRTLTNATKDTP